jgi:hypothetical protein
MNMLFLRSTQNISYESQQNIPTHSLHNMLLKRRGIQPYKPPQVSIPVKETPPPQPKMLWGPAIWYLFHTLAEKVKPEAFPSIRKELLNNIYSICIHLPCPVCSDHAKEYLNKINFNAITTKDELKHMLFTFHNVVNQRKGYTQFTIQELNEKYSNANTVNIIQNFMIYFKDKHRSPKLMADDLQRARISSVLQDWFRNHIREFE